MQLLPLLLVVEVVSTKPGQEAPCLMCSLRLLLVEYQELELDFVLFLENLNLEGNLGESGDLLLVELASSTQSKAGSS